MVARLCAESIGEPDRHPNLNACLGISVVPSSWRVDLASAISRATIVVSFRTHAVMGENVTTPPMACDVACSMKKVSQVKHAPSRLSAASDIVVLD